MDRDVPPGVTYWTGIWRPGLEAISNEVATLRDAIAPGAPLVSFSSGQSSALLWGQRALRLSANRWVALRAIAATLEPLGDVTHAWGAIDDWHFLRCLGRRPMIMTLVLPGTPLPPASYASVGLFVAEAEPLAAQLRSIGIARESIRVVYPGVDLETFAPSLPPAGRFRLLFASSPAHVAEFDRRGIPLLVQLAKARPDIDVVLLWRSWGDQGAVAQALAALDPPPNLAIETLGARTMPEVFRGAHAVACLYAEGFGKSCPNSVVEGLACGRPVLVSKHCGIAELVESRKAGRAVGIDVAEAAAAVDEIRSQWWTFARQARAMAVEHHDEERFIESYRALYADLRFARSARLTA